MFLLLQGHAKGKSKRCQSLRSWHHVVRGAYYNTVNSVRLLSQGIQTFFTERFSYKEVVYILYFFKGNSFTFQSLYHYSHKELQVYSFFIRGIISLTNYLRTNASEWLDLSFPFGSNGLQRENNERSEALAYIWYSRCNS